MRMPQMLILVASGVLTPLAMLFLQDTVKTMLPWVMAMFAVITCDLIAGIRKSLKLGVHVSWSLAFRETMGKMVVYFATVLMVAMIDAASEHSFKIAMWGSLFICALEGGSIVSNLLKPYGVELSVRGILRMFVSRWSGNDLRDSDLVMDDEKKEEITRRERDRWERKRKPSAGKGTKKE